MRKRRGPLPVGVWFDGLTCLKAGGKALACSRLGSPGFADRAGAGIVGSCGLPRVLGTLRSQAHPDVKQKRRRYRATYIWVGSGHDSGVWFFALLFACTVIRETWAGESISFPRGPRWLAAVALELGDVPVAGAVWYSTGAAGGFLCSSGSCWRVPYPG